MWTKRMLESLEARKALYAAYIAERNGEGCEFEYGQWCRINSALSYLSERAER